MGPYQKGWTTCKADVYHPLHGRRSKPFLSTLAGWKAQRDEMQAQQDAIATTRAAAVRKENYEQLEHRVACGALRSKPHLDYSALPAIKRFRYRFEIPRNA